MKVVFK